MGCSSQDTFARKFKEKLIFLWYFPRLIVPLEKVLSLESKNKITFFLYFARLFVPLRPITGIMTLVKAACETFVENNIALCYIRNVQEPRKFVRHI